MKVLAKTALGLVLGLAAIAMAPAMVSSVASAQEYTGKKAGDFKVRLRGIAVMPQENSTIGTIGGKVEAESDYVPEVDFSYFVADQWAFELIAATTRHTLTDKNSTLGNVPLSKTRLLPPTLTLQWHPWEKAQFSPYIGGGVNYTLFFDNEVQGPTAKSVSYTNSFGAAAQIGFDYALNNNWSLNADVKWIKIGTEAKINNTITGHVDLDPIIVGLGIGYKF